MLDVKLDKQPEKFLRTCDRELFERIAHKLKELKQNPVPHDSKRVLGYEASTFRIRIGKIRALYRIDYGTKIIIVVKIDYRERVY